MATQVYHNRDTEVTSRMQRLIMTLARWLAKKAVRAEMKAMGRRPERTEALRLPMLPTSTLWSIGRSW
jgi:hypothetical protein